ncbi:MAG: tetratricopeptide repeat protein [Bryobacteraceae bacterium]|nr:tetratricopeptide repeat protein [Bryobacteraceae bacterium]
MPWFAAIFLAFLFQVDHAAEGRKALEANNYALAEEHYRKAVEAEARDWAARFHLALALSLQNKDGEATEAYRKVLEDQPGLYEAELNLGILLLRQKAAPEEAARLLESASGKKPKEYRPAFYLGEAQSAAGEWLKAESAYRAALEAQPKSAEAAVGLARVLVKQNRLADAEPLYRLAAGDAEFKRALLELAGLFEQAKQPAKAIPIYREFPDDPGARERLGELLLEGGNAADAVPELESAFQKSPTPANRLALATAYLKAKQPAKALPLLEQSVAAEPKHFELRMFYGRALRDQRTFQPAAREFFTAAQIKPDSKEAWNELTGVLILLENYPQALAALDRARAIEGKDTAAHSYFRAIVLDRMHVYKEALPSYEKFLELSQGKNPEEEFKARQRIRVIHKELSKR